MDNHCNQDNQDNQNKDYLQVLVSTFFAIATLISVAYLWVFIMGGESAKVGSFDMFCVPAIDFQPEPLERTIYLTCVLLSPFLILGFNFYFKRFLDKVALTTDLKVYYCTVSAILIVMFGILGWIGLERVNYFYLIDNYYYDHTLISVLIVSVLIGCFLKLNLDDSGHYFNKTLFVSLNIISILILLAVFMLNIFDMKYIMNYTHFEAVFYSVSQVCMGKAVLINFTNQYGLYPHFLEPIFKIIGLSVLKYSIVMSTLVTLCFGLIFLFFKDCIDNKLIGFLGFATFLYFPYLFGNSFIGHDPYFQYVPVRFLFPTLLVYLSFRYFKNNSKTIYYGLHAMCAIAFLWNTETGILVFFTWLITLIYIELFNTDCKTILKSIGKHIFVAFLSLAVVILSYYLYAYARYGATPSFNFEYQKMFYTLGYNMLPMPKIHPWNLIAIAYLLGLSYCARALLLKNASARVKIVFLVSILGIGIFSYYQGRSHDLVLPTVMYQAIILTVICADGLYKTIRTNQKDYIKLVVFCLLIYFFSSSVFSLISTYNFNYNLIKTTLARVSSKEPAPIIDSIDLIKKHTKKGEKILILSYKSGVYFAETQTVSALDIPSFAEMFLNKDLTLVEQAIKEAKVDKVFLDATFLEWGKSEGHARILEELVKNYQIKDRNKWVGYYVPK